MRSAARTAGALHAQWLAVYVETPKLVRLPQPARDRILQTLRLAGELGAETANLSGESVAATLIEFARRSNVSRIIVGKPLRSRWRDRFDVSLVDELIRESGTIDIYVISGEPGEESPAPPRIPKRSSRWPAYLKALAVVAVATLICSLMSGRFESTNVVMVYLLGTVIVAARFGRGPSVLAAVLSVGLFDFLFVPPQYSFAVSDTQYVITFGVMLITALLISHLAALGKRQASVARQRERRAAELYALSRELSRRRTIDELSKFLVRHVLASIEGEAAVLLPDADGKIQDPAHFCDRGSARSAASIVRYPVPGNDLGIAQWAYDHRKKAGLHTDTLASATAMYLPLNALKRCIGVLGLRPSDRAPAADSRADASRRGADQSGRRRDGARAARRGCAGSRRAGRIGTASQRAAERDIARLPHAARNDHRFRVDAARQRRAARRNAAPRAARYVAARSRTHEPTGRQSARSDAFQRRTHRAQARLGRDRRVDRRRAHAAIRSACRASGIAAPAAGSSAGFRRRGDARAGAFESSGERRAAHAGRHCDRNWRDDVGEGSLEVVVRDHGPGFPAGEESRVFEKFHQARPEGAQSGFGLGLAICKAVVEAHGGTISARNAPGGGAEFRFTLPLPATEPPVP